MSAAGVLLISEACVPDLETGGQAELQHTPQQVIAAEHRALLRVTDKENKRQFSGGSEADFYRHDLRLYLCHFLGCLIGISVKMITCV